MAAPLRSQLFSGPQSESRVYSPRRVTPRAELPNAPPASYVAAALPSLTRSSTLVTRLPPCGSHSCAISALSCRSRHFASSVAFFCRQHRPRHRLRHLGNRLSIGLRYLLSQSLHENPHSLCHHAMGNTSIHAPAQRSLTLLPYRWHCCISLWPALQRSFRIDPCSISAATDICAAVGTIAAIVVGPAVHSGLQRHPLLRPPSALIISQQPSRAVIAAGAVFAVAATVAIAGVRQFGSLATWQPGAFAITLLPCSGPHAALRFSAGSHRLSRSTPPGRCVSVSSTAPAFVFGKRTLAIESRFYRCCFRSFFIILPLVPPAPYSHSRIERASAWPCSWPPSPCAPRRNPPRPVRSFRTASTIFAPSCLSPQHQASKLPLCGHRAVFTCTAARCSCSCRRSTSEAPTCNSRNSRWNCTCERTRPLHSHPQFLSLRSFTPSPSGGSRRTTTAARPSPLT